MPAVVTVKGLTKRYHAYSSPISKLRHALFGGDTSAREFVALDDVSFELHPGTALGVVGPNGAGKSTLLKILAGIVEPTQGEVHLSGKIASIIELGAGFHPDFTGRENVFLNGALHGYTDAQTQAKYGEVERFCELGSYMEMPVRTYSSGMFVRLAFAVAISAEPDILLVDEAMAVGDAVFAHRCLSRIREMRERGVTIVFVSHDTNTIAGVCDRAIFLNRGRLVADGPPRDVIHVYLLNVAERLTTIDQQQGTVAAAFHEIGAVEETQESNERRFGSFRARITELSIESESREPVEKIVSGENTVFRAVVRFDFPAENPVFGLMLKNRFGVEVFGTNTYLRKQATGSIKTGECLEVLFKIPMHLGKGIYAASFAVHTADGHYFDYRVDAKVFEVIGAVETIGIVNLPVDVVITPIDGVSEPDGLLARLYAHAPELLDMSETSDPFLRGDWYAAQGSVHDPYRWIGTHAECFISVGEQTTQLRVRVRNIQPGGRSVQLKVSVDGEPRGNVDVSAGEWQESAVSLPDGCGGRTVTVRLEPDSTWVPCELDSSLTDDRRLGVMIGQVRAD